MLPLRIALDADLKARWGAEIAWSWRQLLTALGYAWVEVAPDAPCDIAYMHHMPVAASTSTPLQARMVILADPARWANPTGCQLAQLHRNAMPAGLRFADDVASLAAPTVRDGVIWLQRDVIFDYFWLATGQEEVHWPQDAHGFFTLPDAWLAQRALEAAPASAIVEALGALWQEYGLGAPLPRWPQGKRAAAAITHDVDYPEVIRWLEPLRIVRRQGSRGFGPAWEVLTGRRTHWAFPQWMDFETRYGVRSAFYFVARQGSLIEYARGTPDPFYDVTAPRFRALFRTLIEGGWEVGMHASYLAYAARERFAGEKQRLEQAAGAPVVGNRHHYWHLNPTDPTATLQLHADIGLLYDTSLTHDRYLGWRRGVTTPFYPLATRTRREIGVVQLPVAWMDAQLAQRTDLTQPQRDAMVCELVELVAAQQGLFVANVHDYVFDEVLFPGWLATLRAALERIVARGDFWVATPVAIARHWSDRYRRLLSDSIGLTEGR
ncbi:MAG TPA: hypothetical protein DCL15_19485 [Chloroflexi bacterium]|nr:hypothetical protein [Chloroflexota bacterium]HHW87562.1 hypothetical protein [Chloroflexota bacterium]